MFDWLESGLLLRLREQVRKMWVRVLLYSGAGVVLAVAARLVEPYLPAIPGIDLAAGSVDSLLNVIASSMLTVTTFSMSIIVGAYGSATSNATPRATRLLAEDRVAQNAVSTFIGAFMFSIVGIIGLSAGFYPDQARALLFLATVLVIVTIVVALLRWVSHLNDFGRVSDIVERIETAALQGATIYRERPALGAVPKTGALADGPVLQAEQAGYVRFIDMRELQDLAEQLDLQIEILRMPGKYVHLSEPLLRLSRPVGAPLQAALHDAFSIGDQRSFDQDLGYGLTVLSEVASKALSPGINDPGTAIEALRAGTRVLAAYHLPSESDRQPRFDRVFAPPLDYARLYSCFFTPIARDGAGLLEVQETVQDCLAAVASFGDHNAATREADRARQRAETALTEEWEKEALRRA